MTQYLARTPQQGAPPTNLSLEATSLVDMMNSWPRGGAAPEEIHQATDEQIHEITVVSHHVTKPAHPEVIAVLIERMFRLLPNPDGSVMAQWLEQLSPFPEWLLREAIREVEGTHLSTKLAPLPSHVVKRCRDNPTYQKFKAAGARIEYVRRLKQRAEYIKANTDRETNTVRL